MKRFKESLFYNSFRKLDSRIFFVVLFELCFFVLLLFAFKYWGYSIEAKGAEIMRIELSQMTGEVDPVQAQQDLATVKGFLLYMLASLVVLVVGLFLAWSLYQGLIWTRILKKKFTARYYKRFLLFNLVFVFILLLSAAVMALLAGIISLIVGEFQALIPNSIILGIIFAPITIFIYIPLVLIVFNITNLSYLYFTKETKRLFEGIGSAFGLTFSDRIVPLYKSYLWMGIVFVIVSQVFWMLDLLPENMGMFLGALILLFYLAWVRFYLADVVESLKV